MESGTHPIKNSENVHVATYYRSYVSQAMEVNGRQDQPPEGSTPKGLASSDDARLGWIQCLQCPQKVSLTLY